MCRAYGKSFRKVVLSSVVFLGLYAIVSVLLSGSNKSQLLNAADRNYFEREYGEGKDGKGEAFKGEKFEEQSLEEHSFKVRLQAHESAGMIGKKPIATYQEFLSTSTFTTTKSAQPSTIQEPLSPPSPVTVTTEASSQHSPPPSRKSTNSRILLLYDTSSAATAKEIRILLQSHRIPHDVYLYRPDYLEDGGRGRYCALIFADLFSLYSDWLESHRHNLLNHARTFGVTFVSFINTTRLLSNHTGYDMEFKVGDFIVWGATVENLLGINLNRDVDFYYLKTGEMFAPLDVNTTYVGINLMEVLAEMKFRRRAWYRGKDSLPVVAAGKWDGKMAGITQVVIGMPISCWLTKMLFLESMRTYLGSHSLARFGRERWVMVDIDDTFVAPKGLKMRSGDVEVSLCVWRKVGRGDVFVPKPVVTEAYNRSRFKITQCMHVINFNLKV